MRVPAVAVVALFVAAPLAFAGCTEDSDDGRLRIVLLIPRNLRAWGFEHLTMSFTNVSLETNQDVVSEWAPSARSGDLAHDTVVFDRHVPPAAYDIFGIWIENLRGVFTNGTEVAIETEPFVGRLHINQDNGKEVLVLAGREITFQVTSEIVKNEATGTYVWK